MDDLLFISITVLVFAFTGSHALMYFRKGGNTRNKLSDMRCAAWTMVFMATIYLFGVIDNLNEEPNFAEWMVNAFGIATIIAFVAWALLFVQATSSKTPPPTSQQDTGVFDPTKEWSKS